MLAGLIWWLIALLLSVGWELSEWPEQNAAAGSALLEQPRLLPFRRARWLWIFAGIFAGIHWLQLQVWATFANLLKGHIWLAPRNSPKQHLKNYACHKCLVIKKRKVGKNSTKTTANPNQNKLLGKKCLGKLGCNCAGADVGKMPGHADAIGFALTFVRIEKFLRLKKKRNYFSISQLAMTFKVENKILCAEHCRWSPSPTQPKGHLQEPFLVHECAGRHSSSTTSQQRKANIIFCQHQKRIFKTLLRNKSRKPTSHEDKNESLSNFAGEDLRPWEIRTKN